MNKTELIKRIEGMGEYEAFVDEPISKRAVLNAVSELTEPKKVTVPKSVAEWIVECKQSNNSLIEAMDLLYESHFPEDCEWLTRNSEIFARAWLDGYEVEQEKLYTVGIPNPNSLSARRTYLGKVESAGKIQLRDVKEPNSLCQLTEAEIRQDFDWAWQAGFAKEVGK